MEKSLSDEHLTGMLQSYRRNNKSILLLARQVHTELSKSRYINMELKNEAPVSE